MLFSGFLVLFLSHNVKHNLIQLRVTGLYCSEYKRKHELFQCQHFHPLCTDSPYLYSATRLKGLSIVDSECHNRAASDYTDGTIHGYVSTLLWSHIEHDWCRYLLEYNCHSAALNCRLIIYS